MLMNTMQTKKNRKEEIVFNIQKYRSYFFNLYLLFYKCLYVKKLKVRNDELRLFTSQKLLSNYSLSLIEAV
jgi:hypothetical protein